MIQRDVLFFMVCHCAVSDSWIEPILRVIAENPKHYRITTTYMVMDKWADDPHSSGYGSGSIMKWNGLETGSPPTAKRCELGLPKGNLKSVFHDSTGY